jgi:hypothetical protein
VRVTYLPKCTDGKGVRHEHLAEGQFFSAEGLLTGYMCRPHAEECVREYAAVLGEKWTFVEERPE